MKLLFVLAAAMVVVLGQDLSYTNKYDNIDVDEILKSPRLFTSYYKCLMDMGPCTAEGNELKKHLPDALSNACAKCTEKQREFAVKILNELIANHPDEWTTLRAKYDPDNKLVEKFRETALAAGVKL
ncbi:ejaculatory bulb-specific protein 3-like [Topomyia yanbarensis]|uniref:ejaculatory bulb-specific protein 3-like n=1 Tax=Topomyia yanbarensis TaxID=2498891 RepID=UPI00273C981E|nr:ejaculatory bulb-specific protein 3-like [Topomyia yanbarensis]